MYKIEKRSVPYETITVRNRVSGESFSFTPEFAGNIFSLKLRSQTGELTEVIDGYKTPESMKTNRDFKSSFLFPFVGRLPGGEYNFNDKDYQFSIDEPDTNSALHGFFHDRKFALEEIKNTDKVVKLSLKNSYRSENKAYPFKFDFNIIYTFNTKGLKYHIAIKNVGLQKAPLNFGLHFYFQLSTMIDDLSLFINAEKEVELNTKSLVPTGELLENKLVGREVDLKDQKFDNVFRFQPENAIRKTRLVNKEKDIKLTLWQETGPDKMNYLIIYTPENRKSIAIEPVTSNINSFNTGDGLIVLNSGETFSAEFGIKVK